MSNHSTVEPGDEFDAPIGYYGWQKALPGTHALLSIADTSAIKILRAVDPKVDMPPIVNQSRLGACTANALARQLRGDAIADGKDCGPLTRLGIYYDERYLEGSLGRGDTGAIGHDGLQAAATWGIPPEKEWPYKISTFQEPPANFVNSSGVPVQWLAAQAYKLTKPVKALNPTILDAKSALSNKQKIAVGFTVYESFESSQVARDGMVPMPQPEEGEQIVGGHEVLISGYDPAEPNYLICDNSWGTGWGQKGRFMIPIAYILSSQYSGDWRTIQRPVGK